MSAGWQGGQPRGPIEGPGNNEPGAVYRFLACTAGRYMTPSVTTVTRKVTMRELGALFEKHDFNTFPVVQGGRMLGVATKLDFLKALSSRPVRWCLTTMS